MPTHRRYNIPYAEQADRDAVDSLAPLDANLAVFGATDAQVLVCWKERS